MSDIRKLKVYYQSAGDSSVPTILLKGKWLEKYGFTTGTYIAVECENGKLTIVPREPDKSRRWRNVLRTSQRLSRKSSLRF